MLIVAIKIPYVAQGFTEFLVYDDAGRLISAVDTDGNNNVITSYEYEYDALGRMITEASLADNSVYEMEYDDMGRLVSRIEYDSDDDNVILNEEHYVYDDAGNITGSSTTAEGSNTYTYYPDNTLKKVNNEWFFVNENGNTTNYILNGRKTSVYYDSKNRLKRLSGNTYEYWYDVDDNRIDMYAASTNTMYTYDSSDGRNRLVWTKDHNYNETIYAYGAEGLTWSLCNGTYKVYHYDYRGSVVAVTDINGNITDTIKYDAYGAVSSRMGTSKLIFGYNGRYGVLTDPNGLLYMRSRYYSPHLKRFMSRDIIDGSIADSTSLNIFTFVNGNPISFVDPFGLSAERTQELIKPSEIEIIGSLVINPWSELNYPGEIHNAVQDYYVNKYGFIKEKKGKNPHNRYDLYDVDTNSYWEVKPISHINDITMMEKQMQRYDGDGVLRGEALGISSFPYRQYTVKVYSYEPGKIFYKYEYDSEKQLEESPVLSFDKEEVSQFSFDYVKVGVAVTGVLIILAGFVEFAMTGNPTNIEMGWSNLTRCIN